MKYYQEISLLPHPEIPLHFLWSKVYGKIHIALASQMKDGAKGTVGLAFPCYTTEPEISLGDTLRVFADREQELKQLDLKRVLRRYADYVHIQQIREVPRNIKGYAVYSRYHAENRSEQKARRYAKRHDISLEEARRLFRQEKKKKTTKLPYIKVKSCSNAHGFSLFIQKRNKEDAVQDGFSAYGFDNNSTIPEF